MSYTVNKTNGSVLTIVGDGTVDATSTDITLVGNHPSYKTAVTFSINKSDIVTCVSNSLKKDTLDQFEIKKEIKVIPNFIDLMNNLGADIKEI